MKEPQSLTYTGFDSGYNNPLQLFVEKCQFFTQNKQ